MIGSPMLALALACSKCGAKPGESCVRLDGKPASRSHLNRTPAAPCGSYGGYQRHKRLRETPCDECREANRRYIGQYRRDHPEVRERDMEGLRATNRATARLIDRHRDEWKALVAEEKEAAS